MRFAFAVVIGLGPLLLGAQIHPQSIGGLSLWVNADEGVTTLANGKVTDWADLSGSNNHLIQATDSRRPVLYNNILNGRSGVRFDGINDLMDFPEIEGIRCVFWVIRESDNVTPTYRGLLGHSATYDFIRGANNLLWDPVNANAGILQGITRLRFEEINGTQTAMPPGYQLLSLQATQGLEANRFSKDRNSNSTVWSGELLQLIIYTQELSETEVEGVENWLADYYSSPLSAGEDVHVDYGFCDTTLSANDGFPSYTWSNGSQGQSIQVNQSGWYWVEATDALGRVMRDSVHVQFPGKLQPSETFSCQGQLFLWDTELNTDDYTFLWQDGSTGSTYSLESDSVLVVAITDSVGCTYNSPPVQVVFDDFALTAAIHPDSELCVGEPVGLSGGDFPGLSYLWNGWHTGPMVIYSGEPEITLEVTNGNGCIAYDTLQVTSLGMVPQVAFEVEGACALDNILFAYTGVSENSIVSWEWGIGEEGQAFGTNVEYSFSYPGSYPVSLRVTDSNGCSGVLLQNVVIHPRPMAAFDLPTLCSGAPALFQSISQLESGELVSQEWTISGQTFSGAQAEFVFTTPGFHEVNLMVNSDQGCSDTYSMFVNVGPAPSPAFSASDLCYGVLTDFEAFVEDNGAGEIVSYQWNFGDNTGSSLQNPTHFYTTAGTYQVSLSVVAENDCEAYIVQEVTISIPPSPVIAADHVCNGGLTSLYDVTEVFDETILEWEWSIPGVGEFEGDSISLLFPLPGVYQVTMEILSNTGCTAQVTRQVEIFPLPQVSFTHSPEIGASPLGVSFSAEYNQPISLFQWSFGDGDTYSGGPLAEHIYTENGIYTAELLALSPQGCAGGFIRQVIIEEPVLDLHILYAGLSNSGVIETLVLNEGNYPIESLEYFQRNGTGPWYREIRYGRVDPGETVDFVFNSAPANPDNGVFFCVVVNDAANPERETDLSDNEVCVERTAEEFTILHIWPVPFDEWIDVAFLSTIRGEVNFSLYSASGAYISGYETQADKGYNRYRLDLGELSAGTYILQAEMENGTAVKYLFGGR